MSRIQLLASPKIQSWWTESSNDPQRQDKLRKATEIGLEIVNGSKAVIDADKLDLYDAIEKLLNSGIISWWAESNNDPERQEKLRRATEIGLEVIDGSKLAIEASELELYHAFKKLIKSDVVGVKVETNVPKPEPEPVQPAPAAVIIQHAQPVEPQSEPLKGKPQPNLGKLSGLRRSVLESE
ncbi:hypothetical protein RB620_24835 [Paenibacillus sp. LHD-117]|uniref:hypothetical protein n=1 Tax=Paenibacillus sp. LHD-117 TaxID=3071412 RepID=UPI0027DF6F43|nr:hypothetical protein [Paenibacillus sp. LHD-117]MDQ6422664.1 hypothetical protein [Paenibacillus sp. LHD-117]